ncbi:MAG: phospho-N-acetylmuramoyl-pentapeptide-transferase [Pirellulales bacterium]|nr:phospho-N-acetylmuramoyl-pentapeptide-transferase [Pirellulales bacterium]
MFLWFIERHPDWTGAAWEKITLRASLAAMVGCALALALGPRLIGWLGQRFREPIKCDSPEVQRLHQSKQLTPTMGGLFLVAGLVSGLVVFGDLANPFIQIALLLALGLAAIGAVDDLAKLRREANGLSPRAKFLAQLVVASVAAAMLYQHHAGSLDGLAMHVPLTQVTWPLGLGFIPLAVLVLVGSSNAVNLTDGLDGLAGGCLVCAATAMGLVAHAAGHAQWAAYLGIPHVADAGEMAVLAGAMVGGLMGFLWFNCHPAQVFMGDTGSLPLGGLLGLVALAARQELLLVLIGGVFVVEAASVIIQVIVYRWRRRRVFRCAPIHHHFQLLGWPESRIVARFWIASALCALVGAAALKLSVDEPPRLESSPLEIASQPGDTIR